MIHVIKKVKKPAKNVVEELGVLGSATVHEAMGRRGAMHSSIKPLCSGMTLSGPALTVKTHPGDNLMLLKAIDMVEPGDVLVVDPGSEEVGPLGEIMALQALVKGAAGMVSSGSVRDSLQIKNLGFQVFCKGVCIKGTAKESLGLINHPMSCGDVMVRPGDIIIGDEDGVVVVPQEEAEEILVKAKERVAKEEKIMAEIRAGKSFFEMMGYPEVMKKKGCIEEE